MLFYVVSVTAVFVLSGLLSMAGLGAAFLFVPLFYYMGVSLPEATATALLLNVVSLSFATVNYWRGHLVNLRIGVPVMLTAVALAPFGARLTLGGRLGAPAGAVRRLPGLRRDDDALLPAAPARAGARSRHGTSTVGVGVGGVAGFLGGLLGVGGGNFIVPVLNWFGLDAKVAAATTAFAVVFASLSGFLAHATVGQPRPHVRRGLRRVRRRRFDRRLTARARQAVERDREVDHRRAALGHRREDDLRPRQLGIRQGGPP